MENKNLFENSAQENAELDNLIDSFELEELEERIELGCFSGCSGTGLCLWNW